MDSTPVDSERVIAQLRMFVEGTEALRNAADRMMRMRDEAIRQADAAGHISRVELARLAGVDRSRLYVILANLDEADDDAAEAVHDTMDRLMDEAVTRWSNAGGEGFIDDYFPIEDLVRRESA